MSYLRPKVLEHSVSGVNTICIQDIVQSLNWSRILVFQSPSLFLLVKPSLINWIRITFLDFCVFDLCVLLLQHS